MIGRKKEITKIERLIQSDRSEFLAVTGRRRVGKTYLIDTLLQSHYCFSMTGIQNADLRAQLTNFAVKLSEYSGSDLSQIPSNWQLAFLLLKNYLKTLDRNKKQVIFIDELPWIDTHRSGFVQILAHFWNDYLSKESHFILIICGSATSWIAKKIIDDKGGLHNRITESIHLHPFTITETRTFLSDKGLNYSLQDLARLYMTLGGIPFYLDHLRKGESYAASIERMCFSPSGILRNEYNNLLNALFGEADMHRQIIEILAGKHYGLPHTDIIKALKIKQPTGTYQRAMEELIISDFITENIPLGRKKRGVFYRLSDEYCLFYHTFIKPVTRYTPGIWQQFSENQAFKTWAGYAFENICHKHIDALKHSLGIGAVYTETFALYVPADEQQSGFQIDLIIDRKDQCINLCEIKFHNGPFTITKEYYLELIRKKQRFIEYTGTKKQVFITLITNFDLNPNMWSAEVVDVAVTLEQLSQFAI